MQRRGPGSWILELDRGRGHYDGVTTNERDRVLGSRSLSTVTVTLFDDGQRRSEVRPIVVRISSRLVPGTYQGSRLLERGIRDPTRRCYSGVTEVSTLSGDTERNRLFATRRADERCRSWVCKFPFGVKSIMLASQVASCQTVETSFVVQKSWRIP